MNKPIVFLIIGMIALLLALPSLYWGLCLAVAFNSMSVMPWPAVVCILAAFALFYKAEQTL